MWSCSTVFAQQPRCYRICDQRTNHRKNRGPNGERPDDLPALPKQLAVIVAAKRVWIRQQRKPFFRNPYRPAQYDGADGVRRDDDGDECQKWVIDEGAAVDGNFVKAEKKCYQCRENCVQPEKRAESDEDAD